MCILLVFMLFGILLKYILMNFTRPFKNMTSAYLTPKFILDFVLFRYTYIIFQYGLYSQIILNTTKEKLLITAITCTLH